ncbi:vitamin B12 dependent-methionine synthase activation domain-containing protein, partial [Streptomyces sp. NPDC048106]|uniref:vitamin B12 dependent-methionine synthase activation domain-containing protein n=1 Tax=Streptomyces sp. NPDC048106 TaxID=3155750 RepID=UPI003451200F
SDVATDNPVPTPPFWGTRVVKGIQLKEYASWLDEGALFKGQWGLDRDTIETEGRPRLRRWLDLLRTRGLLEAAVVHGYFPCVSKDDDLIVLDEHGAELTRFTFPRQSRGRRLCLADFFRPEESGETDVVGFQVVTVGSRVGEETARLFEADAGYPACPDLEDRAKIATLLEPERIGVHLSEEFQLHPEQSTDAIVVHHPEAGYFNAGRRA